MVQKFFAVVLAAILLAGGSILVALAGLLVALLTDPFYPFWPFFLPLVLGIIAGALYLDRRLLQWLLPDLPDLNLWVRCTWAATALILALIAWGVGDLLTGPMHWQ